MRTLLLSLVFLLGACSSEGAEEASDPGMGSVGGESPDMAQADEEGMASEEEPAGEPMEDTPAEPAPTGPARLKAGLTVNDEPVPGKVRIMSTSGEEVKAGTAGQVFSIPAGNYVVVGSITDESVLADKPEKEGEPFSIGPGEERTENVEFGLSQVRLKVMKRGKHIQNARVDLRRQGTEEVVLRYKYDDEYTRVSPGRYEATVIFGVNRIEVSGIMFQGGAKQDIPLRVN